MGPLTFVAGLAVALCSPRRLPGLTWTLAEWDRLSGSAPTYQPSHRDPAAECAVIAAVRSRW